MVVVFSVIVAVVAVKLAAGRAVVAGAAVVVVIVVVAAAAAVAVVVAAVQTQLVPVRPQPHAHLRTHRHVQSPSHSPYVPSVLVATVRRLSLVVVPLRTTKARPRLQLTN